MVLATPPRLASPGGHGGYSRGGGSRRDLVGLVVVPLRPCRPVEAMGESSGYFSYSLPDGSYGKLADCGTSNTRARGSYGEPGGDSASLSFCGSHGSPLSTSCLRKQPG